MRKPNIRIHLRRAMAAALAGVMSVSLSVSALAAGLGYTPGCPLCDPSVSGNARPSASFSDVPDTHTFHDAIMWCAEQGIVGGYSDGTFKPTNTVTNSNFTVMLSRAFYAGDVALRTTESNMKYGAFYPNYVAMYFNGALNNTSFSTLSDLMNTTTMNKGINRYDMAQLMTNIMNSKGFAASSSDKNAAISKIADYSEIPSQYRDAVLNVYALGIIGGYSNGTFGGTVTMNRGQAAIVIYRMMQFSGNSGSGSGNVTNPDPETPVDPATGEVVCACVTTTGKLCELCHSTAPGTTTPVTPSQPETPAAKTLVDGSAVTEANVMRLMEAKRAEWGNKTFGVGSNDQSVYPKGNAGDMVYIINHYRTVEGYSISFSGGCGGLSAYLSDAAFGNTGFPLRKLDSADKVRAGDIVLYLTDGGIYHVAVASGKTNVRTFNGVPVTNHGVYDAGSGTLIGHSPNGIDMSMAKFTTNYDSTTGTSSVIYTRYPN